MDLLCSSLLFSLFPRKDGDVLRSNVILVT